MLDIINIILPGLGILSSIIGIGLTLQTLINTRKRSYKEFLDNKKKRNSQ